MIDVSELSDEALYSLSIGVNRFNKARQLFMLHWDLCNELAAPINIDQRAFLRQQFKAIASIAQVLGVTDKDLMS